MWYNPVGYYNVIRRFWQLFFWRDCPFQPGSSRGFPTFFREKCPNNVKLYKFTKNMKRGPDFSGPLWQDVPLCYPRRTIQLSLQGVGVTV